MKILKLGFTTDSGNLATTGKGSAGACALTGSNVSIPDAVLIKVRRTSCPTNNAFPRLVNKASIPDRRVVGGGGTGTLGAIVVRIVDDAIIEFWLADGERLLVLDFSHWKEVGI